MDVGWILIGVVAFATALPILIGAGVLYGIYRLLRARARKRLTARKD
jgi:hypothetical protein